ncbi:MULTISPECIES: TIGR00730 family Rossman fold protein [unclassified Kitasatospora]|uniref:LOG family protein n=1 Tax=unclassified Kitasatospora TaxID=2633591 RepID=UPI0037FEC399
MTIPPAAPSRIGVFCGSRSGSRPEYLRTARDLGAAIARRGGSLVYGAGGVGLMGAVSRAAHEAGAEVFGVIPDALHERERLDDARGEVLVVEGMHTRKALMYEMADAFVVLPGGYGTMDELMEVSTWNQLGFHWRPVALANVAGFFDPLITLLDRMVEEGFLGAEERGFIRSGRTAEECLDALMPAPAEFLSR